jgi:hypothetical protein
MPGRPVADFVSTSACMGSPRGMVDEAHLHFALEASDPASSVAMDVTMVYASFFRFSMEAYQGSGEWSSTS